jgi:diguanylate cyclase (GGDEF)-like protein
MDTARRCLVVTRVRVANVALPHLRVGGKFFLAVGVLLLALLGVAVAGEVSLTQTKRQADQLFSDHLRTTQRTADLANVLDDVEKAALRRAQTQVPARQVALDTELDLVLIPLVHRTLNSVRDLDSDDPLELRKLDLIQAGFEQYLQLRGAGGSIAPAAPAQAQPIASTSADRIGDLFERITPLADTLRLDETRLAAQNKKRADHVYRSAQVVLGAGVGISLLLGLVVAMLLSRDLVPRIRRYAQFATRIAAGEPTDILPTAGRDELADLGRALNAMVAQREIRHAQDLRQAEFVDTLQVSSTEEEAHQLIQHHLQRTLPESSVLVLQRNNSENRLQPANTMVADSQIAERLAGAEPRSCLAVRFARSHHEGPGLTPLLSCGVCADRDVGSTCEPLLVGGQVIGSVLVSQAQPADAAEVARIKTSVAQAAPVLANLRNLALAEFRANNDALTGLPNKRATDDTLKRMVAQASRSITPLSALMLDLDHFKQINDRFGHDKGDDVLAAVGAALQSCLRAGDFAGRFGGEEFLILLPDTGLDGAAHVAEKIRTTVAAISVPGVARDITASLGIADLLEHAGNATGLLREADRALYAAKAAGRNRAIIAGASDTDATVPAEETPNSRPSTSPRGR